MSKFERDLSKGNIWRQLISFSIPLVIANIIQVLYNVADMIIVGQFSGMESMSGVNIGGQVTNIVTFLAIGLCVGATVLIAQYMGAGERHEMRDTIGTLFTTLTIMAVVITVIMIVLRNPILKLVKTPEEAFSEASNYLMITMLGTFFIFGYNALSAIMRGMGDSRNPMIFVGVACVTNIVLDLILVARFKMGAAGAAVATVFSQAVSMILCIIYLKKNDFIFEFKKENLKIHSEKLKLLLKLGIPSSIQNMVVGMSFLFLIAMCNTMGVAASAAVGAVGKFNGFAIMPAVAISSAVSAMAAQNLGAGEMDRAIKTCKAGTIMTCCLSFLIFALSEIFPAVFIEIFGNDKEMIRLGVEYLRIFAFDYLIVPFVFCFNGLFVGAGHTMFSMVNGMISSIIVRVPAAYFFGMHEGMGMRGIGIGAPVASAASLLCAVIFYVSGAWKKEVIKK